MAQSHPSPDSPAPFRPVFAQTGLVLLIALLLGETTINFIDRQVVSVLQPKLLAEFHMNNSQYAAVVNAFMLTYACSYSFAGWVLDRIGVGRGLTAAISWWSIAGVLTSFARGPLSLGGFRSLLAVGEGGAWPAFAKAVAIWVPPHARTLAIGICNSGSSLGTSLAPLIVGAVTYRWGWRASFVVTGTIGLLWVAAFQWFRATHPEMAASEHELRTQKTPHGLAWKDLTRYRQTWAVFVCRFFADNVWYFYVYWIPAYLTSARGISFHEMTKVAWIPFLVADAANFAAGFLTMRLQKAGWSVNRTRKTLMAIAAVMTPVGIGAAFVQTLFWTITLISVAIFFWMLWSVSVHTLPGDYFPPRAVASVYGIAGTGSTLGAVLTTQAVGWVVDHYSYTPVFVGIGLVMPVALIAGFALMGRVEPVAMREA